MEFNLKLARRYMSSKSSPGLYTRLLIYSAFQVAFISFLLSYYNVQPLSYLSRRIRESQVWDHSVDALRDFLEPIKEIYDDVVDLIDVYDDDDDELTRNPRKSRKRREVKKESEVKKVAENSEKVDISKLPVLTREQLTLFDGSRPSKDVYLALLGRIYNVQKGSKYYAPGGSYHFFAGKDATRAFVTGDFSESGLTDDVRGLSEEDLLGIAEWSSFYEKNYELVGLLQGTYYDAKGKPTPRLQEVKKLTEKANEWKKAQAKENEIFPPCNSEWHKDSGRVWCSAKSGGVQRDWTGVPRKLFMPVSKTFRCACVRNFGAPLSEFPGSSFKKNRGDLDNPNVLEYENCHPSSISCQLVKT